MSAKKVDYTNLAVIREFCKTLIKDRNLKTQDDLHGENGVVKEIQKALYEALLEGELDSHLGYDKHDDSAGNNYRNGYSGKTVKTQHGAINLEIPRDRNASFEPIITPKNQRRLTVLDEPNCLASSRT